MSGKDLILDFLNYVVIILIIIFLISYFIIGDHFTVFTEVIRALAPISFFLIILLVKLKFSRIEFKKNIKDENNEELVLYLTASDKLKSDILVFSSPIIILIIAWLANGLVDWSAIIQATMVFLLMYYWQKILFRKHD